jgi:hypothetical protein
VIETTTPTPLRTAARPTSAARTAAELLLGLSFLVTSIAGGYGILVGGTPVIAQVGAVVFLVTLTCVLVSWFRALDAEDDGTGTSR